MKALKRFINRGILVIYYNRDHIVIGIIIVTAILLIGFLSASGSGDQFNPDNVGSH